MIRLGQHGSGRRTGQVGCQALLVCLMGAAVADAATVPNGFRDVTVVTGLSAPTAMAVAPDGRVFITEQAGTVRVVRDDSLLPTPFVSLGVDARGERGLIGIALDPAFDVNGFVYLHYTAPVCPPSDRPCNRVSRVTAQGDTALAASEVVLIEMDPLSSATNHNGGALHFLSDGSLLIGVGDNATSSNAQTTTNLLGKILRINSDGSIPATNPFYGTATGKNRAIWALGLRNPFTFAVAAGTDRVYINDVGQSTFEEVDDGVAGANYGWPDSEGPTTTPGHTGPVYYYGHGSGPFLGCAIAGGAFYAPLTPQFPDDYRGDYFFADLCGGWINRRDAATGAVSTFASGLSFPVDLDVAPDGRLYYLARGPAGGVVGRIEYVAPRLLSLTSSPAPPFVAGAPVTWTVNSAAGASALYQFWLYDGIAGTWTPTPYSSAASFTFAPPRNGTYAVQVWARNVGSTAAWESFLTSGLFAVGPLRVTSLLPDQQMPIAAGQPVTWTATAADGTGSLEYRYWLYSAATGRWTIGQEYSPAPAWTWTPSQPGKYAIQVWVRQVGAATPFDAWRGTGTIDVAPALPATPTLAVSPGLPVAAGTPLTWAAATTGGELPTQFRFWLYDGNTSTWQVAQEWSGRSTWAWRPSRAGTYAVQVWVRSAGSSASYEAWRGSGYFTVLPSPVTAHSLTPSPPLPNPGGPVTWSVVASGGTAPLEYQFWGYAGGAWGLLRDYGPSDSVTWAVGAGMYALQAWVRSVGSAAAYESWIGSGPFTIGPSPVSVRQLTVDQTFPLPAATPMTWTMTASGGSAPLEYQYWRYSEGAWTIVRPWAASPSWSWTPGPGDVGEHTLQVWVRSTGSAASYDAWLGSGPFRISP